jgi:hypothetical protein
VPGPEVEARADARRLYAHTRRQDGRLARGVDSKPFGSGLLSAAKARELERSLSGPAREEPKAKPAPSALSPKGPGRGSW